MQSKAFYFIQSNPRKKCFSPKTIISLRLLETPTLVANNSDSFLNWSEQKERDVNVIARTLQASFSINHLTAQREVLLVSSFSTCEEAEAFLNRPNQAKQVKPGSHRMQSPHDHHHERAT